MAPETAADVRPLHAHRELARGIPGCASSLSSFTAGVPSRRMSCVTFVVASCESCECIFPESGISIEVRTHASTVPLGPSRSVDVVTPNFRSPRRSGRTPCESGRSQWSALVSSRRQQRFHFTQAARHRRERNRRECESHNLDSARRARLAPQVQPPSAQYQDTITATITF